ncbi:glycosyltransferase [Bacillus timonensis]|uniref:Glycosyltransferase n=1 Tax=Bacillus timonensis TaxID=1033734 RepID=A0A4V3V715_9BACI|nr:glycosyltransferase [Bacillus timonensis]THE09163.1 glycosyltransferase [Bacillus timonensis]
MRDKLISVICTVRNGEKTITQTILSVINQTYHNWEFIIIDDGSNDSTKSILEEFAGHDKRVKPLFTEGIGRGNALNLAIQSSNGDYIANIDADDLMHPKRLRVQLDILLENKDAFLVCSNAIIIYNNESVIWEEHGIEKNEDGIETISENLLIKNKISHSSVMINKQQLIDIGYYDHSLKSQFDYELWLRALANKRTMIKVPYNLIAKRIHENQSFENKKRIIYLLRSQKLQIKYALRMKRKVFIVLIITPLRILLGFLPFQLRRKINSVIQKLV